ncbi:MAG: Omp28-related outer membrane protein [Ignavibacteria bacterium]|nr:Omp28-related outer membrane protein [Ignavibacteria bacterium]
MRKHLLFVFALVTLVGFNYNNPVSQNNVVVEYITGTWCGYCPCGHSILDIALTNYPNTTVLAYHGAGTDPWQSWTAGIRQMLFGPQNQQGYPTAVIGRNSGVLSRSAWYNQIANQTSNQPGVSIQVNNKQYDVNTRTITGNVQLTALTQLTGDYYVMFVLTENNLVYPQNFYSSCGTAGYHNDYIHDHVVKAMINGDQGTLLNTTDNWSQGTQVIVPLNYVVPNTVVEGNSKLNIFVYRNQAPLNSAGAIQQSKVEDITNLTGIVNQNGVPDAYSLGQNYPNPFNPTTNITFSIPKDQNASLKFYNSMGQEVATYLEGFTKAGVYKAEFDGSALSSGIYFYTLKTDDFVETKKMMLVK